MRIWQSVTPYVGVLSHLAGLKSAPQHPLAVDVARWQGEPIAMVVAQSRAEAEDAAELIEADLDPLPVVADMETALDPDTPLIHPDLGTNLAWEREVDAGDVDAALARDDVTVVERTFRFGRHTGVTLEPRATVVEWDPADAELTFHYSGQAPHMMQAILAKHLGLEEDQVRVVVERRGRQLRDQDPHLWRRDRHRRGGKAAGPAGEVRRRPAGELPDGHPRPRPPGDGAHGGRPTGADRGAGLRRLTGIGPFSMYPRTSAIEANQVLNLTGGAL